MIKKKLTFKLKTLKSFIICSLHWQMRPFQVSIPRFRASRPSTKSSSTKFMLCQSFGIFGLPSKPSLPMSNLMEPILVVWGSGCKSCRRPTARPKNWDNKRRMAMKKSMRFFTIKAYRWYPKPFKRSWLGVITTIFWSAILALRRLANCWPKNTTGQPSAITLRPTWKAVTFA